MNRVPPNNLRAEEALLGAMMLTRQAANEGTSLLEPDDFYKPAHGHIFAAILGLVGAGEPVDTITVADELKSAGVLEMIGGPATLLDMQGSTPATSNAGKYSKIIKGKARLRRAAHKLNEILAEIYEDPEDADATIANAETALYLMRDRDTGSTERTLKDLLSTNLDQLEEAYVSGDAMKGVATGLVDLDDMLSGLQSKVYVIAGRPGSGKSAVAIQMATAIAMQGDPVLAFSLEMPGDELSMRVLMNEALVDSTRAYNGNIEDVEWNRISHAVGRLSETPLVIDDNPSVTLMDIRSQTMRLKSQSPTGKLGAVVIDYIQLMEGVGESRQLEVAQISRGLKVLQRDLDCPVIVLAQCNRECEKRVDKRPMLSDLRETGALEQDADVVIFTYRDEIYDEYSPDRGVAELIVRKQRAGRTGTVKLAFRGQYTRFDSMARTVPREPVPTMGDDSTVDYENFVDVDRD